MTFYLLGLSVLLAFMPSKFSIKQIPLWSFCCAAAVFTGYWQGVVDIKGILAVFCYAILLLGSVMFKNTWLRRSSVTVFAVFSLLLAMHVVPGFHNHAVVVKEVISQGAIPYSLYANFDKGLVGVFLIAYFFSQQKQAGQWNGFLPSFKILCLIIFIPCLTLAIAYGLQLVRFDPKVPAFWLSFVVINLLFTCVAEEAFFRGLLQAGLSNWLRGRWPLWIAPLVIAFLFAAAHLSGGIEYALVAGVAGLGYGYVFHLTQRIEWAIFCHYLLNLLHIFLFTYPMLA